MENFNPSKSKFNTIILLFPIWLLLFYFKNKIAYYIVFSLLSLPDTGQFANSLQFFIATSLKMFLLLVLVIFIMGIVRSYFSPDKTRKVLEGKPLLAGNSMAGILGIVTPFCSCSAIPLFLGFIEAGIPLGVTFSFLIAAPLINEVAVIMLIGLFGWKTGILYVLSGLIIAILSGWIIGKMKLEKWVQNWVYTIKSGTQQITEPALTLEQRIICGYDAVTQILSGIWLYILIGIAVGSAIHGYIPQNYLVSVMDNASWYSVPLSVLIGIPLYSCSAGAVPIAFTLIDKGVPLGTALAFMMSVIGLSLPEMIILKKVLKIRLILLFVGILSLGMILVGYLFNWLL
jgi:uncharacterized membrane protein YraQ (UPF0718 family)